MSDKLAISTYQDRRTWPIGVREIHAWQLKVYGICAKDRELAPATIEAALEHAAQHVDWPDRDAGYGFITLHVGEHAVWLLIDLWVDDILRHFLYYASLAEPDQFKPGPSDGTMACVWELAVMMHERVAWIEHIMSWPENPDYESYLRDTLQVALNADL